MFNFYNRIPGSKRDGAGYTELEKWQVFSKLPPVDGRNPTVFRKDRCGAVIAFSDHGNINSLFGWEIDHVYPVAKGGGDEPSNLQALHWKNNRAKGDSTSGDYCVMRY